MSQVVETFLNALLGKFVQEVDVMVAVGLIVVTWIANNFLEWASSNDKLWASWITHQRRKFGIPFAPYVFGIVYYVLWVAPRPYTVAVVGQQCAEAFLQGSVAVAAYVIYRKVLRKRVGPLCAALMRKWGVI